MNMQLLAEDRQPPSVILTRLLDEHGVVRTVLALVSALLRRDRAPYALVAEDFSAHLRRDIGLPPAMESRRHWDHL
jgi:hypothetical protein